MSSRPIVLIAVLAAVAVSGCGKRGVLDRPPPLWGDRGADAGEPVDNSEPTARGSSPYSSRPQAPESQNTSIRHVPIEGAPRDPRGGPGAPSDPGAK
jgi:predicted small lipoprotein YifL